MGGDSSIGLGSSRPSVSQGVTRHRSSRARTVAGTAWRGAALAHRVIYVARFPEAIYVLHGFDKRSRKIGPVDLAVATKRWSDLLRQRRDV